jgi:hypothetical protein
MVSKWWYYPPSPDGKQLSSYNIFGQDYSTPLFRIDNHGLINFLQNEAA